MDNQAGAQMNVSKDVQESKDDIDVGIDATTLPLVDIKKDILDSSVEMFHNVENYLSSEIDVTIEDYKLLESLNHVTTEKYKEMSKTGETIAQSMNELNNKFIDILPKLELIDQLDKKVEHLEKLAYSIDAYSKRLEKQYKSMEKRIASVGNVDGIVAVDAGSSSRSSTPQAGKF